MATFQPANETPKGYTSINFRGLWLLSLTGVYARAASYSSTSHALPGGRGTISIIIVGTGRELIMSAGVVSMQRG